MSPEELQPLLNALGDTNILENLMLFGGVEGAAEIHNTRNKAKSAATYGIHYSGAHWYARLKNNTTTDSYTLNIQKDGTAHFCQTFAAMIYTGHTGNFKVSDYAGNVKVAMDFLLAYVEDVKKHKNIAEWLNAALSEVGLTITTFTQKINQAKGSAALVCTYS